MNTYTDTWTDGHGTVEYFTRSDGSRMRYFTAGSGPALVLMHTIRTQLDYFHRVIPLLWDSFTVYAVDLPGMGWSDIVPGARYEETLPHDFIVELRRSGRRKGYSRVFRAIYRSLKEFIKARDRYRDVSVPVTLVYSEDDWARPAERDYVAGLLTEVERITLPDTGHFSALERPNEVARILRRAN
jgi:pimeloyl-ACP methyl ester carboxylesterase